jgi:hypothetical protein
LDPFLPGEKRNVNLGPFYFPCKAFKEIKLLAFVAKGINSDGTIKHRNIKDGKSALIIENNTNFKVEQN